VLPPGASRTTEDRLHDLGTLLALAGLLLSAGASLRIVARRAYRVTIALLFAALLVVVPLLVMLGIDAPGVGQRVLALASDPSHEIAPACATGCSATSRSTSAATSRRAR